MKSKDKQASSIIDALYTQGPQSRIDLAKKLAITPATVSDITQELINVSLIFELGEDSDQTTAGRRKILLDIVPNHSTYLGIELFSHSLALTLSDNTNKILEEAIFEYPKDDPITNEKIISTMTSFMNLRPDLTIKAIGVAIPGHYTEHDECIITNNPFWERISLNTIRNAFNIPVFFENNVNCMAIRERYFGKDTEDPNFLYLHFRRGIFCTYFYHGQIYARNNLFVGEIGHMVVNPSGALCECGKHGCLQTVISQTWLLEKARTLYENSTNTFLHSLVMTSDEIDMNTIMVAYTMGDIAIIEMIRVAIDSLAIVINNMTITHDTYVIYIHSELFNNEILSRNLLQRIDELEAGFMKTKNIKKVITPYSKQDGARAACALAIEQTLMPTQRKTNQ